MKGTRPPDMAESVPELTQEWVAKHLNVTPETAKVLVRWKVAERTSKYADNGAELSASRSALQNLGSEWKLLKGQMESKFPG